MRTSFLYVLLAILAGAPLVHAQTEQRLHRPLEHRNALEVSILNELRKDPLTRNWNVEVDTYRGLAVLHGWVLSRPMREALEHKIADIDGVEAIYNYVVYEHLNDLPSLIEEGANYQVNSAASHVRADELQLGIPKMGLPSDNVPLVITPTPPLALKVMDVFSGDPLASAYPNLRVDSWNDLVILHGQVLDRKTADDFERMAASVPGVGRVYTYLIARDAALNLPTITGSGFPDTLPVAVHVDHPTGKPRVEEAQYTSQPAKPAVKPKEDFR